MNTFLNPCFEYVVASILIVPLASAALIGCSSPHGTVEVSGQITVGGQSPPGSGTITFTPVQPAQGFPTRPAMAEFGPDGKYVATSFQPGDGLIPGSYQVAIECYETPPNMEGKPVKSHIDSKYMNGESSGFAIDVLPGSKAMKFDIPLQ